MTLVILLLLVVIAGCHETHGITSSHAGKTILRRLCVVKSTQASCALCSAVKAGVSILDILLAVALLVLNPQQRRVYLS